MKNRQYKRIWAIVFLWFFWTQAAWAADYYVDARAGSGGDGSAANPFDTIQAGISAAADGDRLLVDEGIYSENLSLTSKDVFIESIGASASTIIDGGNEGRAITSTGSDFVLNGFTIRGGGIYIRQGMPQIQWCTFVNNTAAHGGALEFREIPSTTVNPTVSNCAFYGNSADQNGGAIAIIDWSYPIIKDCGFYDNSAVYGGAVSIQSSSEYHPRAKLDNCRFVANRAEDGGAMYIKGGDRMGPDITDCEFQDNAAANYGGAIYNGYGGIPIIMNTVFWSNTAQENGNAVANFSGKPKFMNSVFCANSSGPKGSGIFNGGSGAYPVEMYNSILFQNQPVEIQDISGGSTFQYCNIEGGYGAPEDFNINTDPLFVDPTAGDFRLRPDSPCIDRGNNDATVKDAADAVRRLPTYDKYGNSRILDGDGDAVDVVDMGIHEQEAPSTVWVDDDWAGLPIGTDVSGHTMGTDAFGAIQDGIDAMTLPGIVYVATGTYGEHIVLSDGVSLQGAGTDATILDGQGLAQDIVTISGCSDNRTGMDGFGLTNGHAGYAGIMATESQITLTNCRIEGSGVGLHMADSYGEIGSCVFLSNDVGVRNYNYNIDEAPTYRNCWFEANESSGMENFYTSPRISYCGFWNQTPVTGSGAGLRNVHSDPEILYCSFVGNRMSFGGTLAGEGGAIHNDDSSPWLTGVQFTSNAAPNGGAIFNRNHSKPVFIECDFRNNDAEKGGAVFSEGTSPSFLRCELKGNEAEYGGGAYSTDTGANPLFENCVFVENESSGSGGALFAGNLSVPKIINSIIYGNQAGTDGSGNGGGIFETYTQPIVINSIIWGNTPNQIYDSSGQTTVSYSDVQGGFPGTGNIDTDPLFVDPASDNFELAATSPCIDSGSTDGGATADMAGTGRPLGLSSDMGVYEYASVAEIQVLPDFVLFGEVLLGDSRAADITVRNQGFQALTLTDLGFAAGTHFSVASDPLPITLAAETGTTVTITFTPGAAGILADILTIDSNDPDEGTLTVHMSGIGAIPPHLITATATAGGSISPAGGVAVADGDDQTFIISADTGYQISDVLVDGSSVGAVDNYIFGAVSTEHTIEARFAPLVYTITASAGSNGSITPTGAVSVPHGADQSFTMTPAGGYIIADVRVDGASVGAMDAYTFTTVTADHTIEAVFDTPHYFISATAGAGGTITPAGSVRVEENADQTFTITPDPWLDIEDVLVDGASVGAVGSYTFTSVTAQHTIEARFIDLVPDVWVDDDYTAGGTNDGHTWNIDAFNHVQGGIDAVTGPAMVHVAEGTYNEKITLKSNITVSGAGPDVTILDIAGLRGYVVTVNDVDDTTVFEGFTLKNGTSQISANEGTGMNLVNSSPIIRDCIFEYNAEFALLNSNSSPRITNCTFRYNHAHGMRNQNNSSPVLEHCTFEENQNHGMENEDSTVELSNCVFRGNNQQDTHSAQGAGMSNWNSTVRLTDCLFENNVIEDADGNILGWGGGGIYNVNGPMQLLGCEFTGNGGKSGGAVFNLGASPLIIDDCRFMDNRGGINSSDGQGGAIYSDTNTTAPTITDSFFSGNTNYFGGAIYIGLSNGTGPATITNCIFDDNQATTHGGAIMAQFPGIALNIVNSVFYHNLADSNGNGTGEGGALYTERGDTVIVNSILYNNNGSEISSSGVTAIARYSNIEGGYGAPEDRNIDAPPLFVDADAEDFRLQVGSPCIDTGTSSSTITLPTTDIEGTARPLGVSHDMGVYEYAAGQDIETSPASLDFGYVTIGDTGSQDITITNAGDQDLEISNIVLSVGTHYMISHPGLPLTLIPSGTVTVTVDFVPTTTGQQDANLTLTSNDPDENPLTISLTGVGVVVTHTITANAGSSGQISPSGDVSVTDGSDQAFTIAPDTGYAIADVLVDGASVGAVGSYDFTNVTGNHTIEAQFAVLAGITVSAVSGNTGEDGTTATFTVVLNREPADTVQMSVVSSDVSEGTVSTGTLSFSTTDWDSPQTVTLSGVDDAVDDGDQSFSVVIGPATSTDAEYDGKDPADLMVVNLDNDTADINVGAISGDTDETGATATFTVVLTSEPTADVQIAVESDDPTEGEVSTGTLIFTPADWNVPQTVTVTGVDDIEEDGDMGYAILLAQAVSADPGYDGLEPADLILSNLDDDGTSTPAGTGGSGGGGGGGGCFIISATEGRNLSVEGRWMAVLSLVLFAISVHESRRPGQ